MAKESLKGVKQQFDNLRTDTNNCIDWVELSGLSIVDFRIYMNSSKLQNAVEVLKLAVARIMRIDDALETNYSPEEISEILKDVQIKVQGEDVDDDSNLLRGTNKLMRNAIKKIDNLQLENQELKMKLSSMDKKIGEISKTVNSIQDDMVDSI